MNDFKRYDLAWYSELPAGMRFVPVYGYLDERLAAPKDRADLYDRLSSPREAVRYEDRAYRLRANPVRLEYYEPQARVICGGLVSEANQSGGLIGSSTLLILNYLFMEPELKVWQQDLLPLIQWGVTPESTQAELRSRLLILRNNKLVDATRSLSRVWITAQGMNRIFQEKARHRPLVVLR